MNFKECYYYYTNNYKHNLCSKPNWFPACSADNKCEMFIDIEELKEERKLIVREEKLVLRRLAIESLRKKGKIIHVI